MTETSDTSAIDQAVDREFARINDNLAAVFALLDDEIASRPADDPFAAGIQHALDAFADVLR